MKINGTGIATVNGVTLIEYYFGMYETSNVHCTRAYEIYSMHANEIRFDVFYLIPFINYATF